MIALRVGCCRPSPPPQLHRESFNGERHPHIGLHYTLSPLFARLSRIHHWFNDPVPHEEREKADRFHNRELAPYACARSWLEMSPTIEAKGVE
jgi:hypothetical protein